VSHRLLTVLLVAVLVPAALLRLPALTASPPGVWLDEAIGAVEGDALVPGLHDGTDVRSARWPVWSTVEGALARLLGATTPVARLPAALAGLLGVLLAWPVTRMLGGRVAATGAAAFLAGSFWFVTANRVALPCTLVVPETLLIGWLLLRDDPLSPGAGVLLVLVCTVAPLGYAASLVTPVLAAGLLFLRVRARGLNHARVELATAAATAILVTIVVLANPDSLQRSSTLGRLETASLGGWIRQSGRVLANWAVGGPAGWGCWNPFPPGTPRATVVEFSLVLMGAAAFARTSIPRVRRIALAGWCALALIPEIAPGDGLHVLRGLPTLAPAAVLAGLGAETAFRLTGRTGGILLAGAIVLNAGRTAWLTFVVMPRDPVACSWYLVADREAADWVRACAAREPVFLTPTPTRAASPVLLFHLRESIRLGRVRGTDVALADPVVERIARDPGSGQPLLFIFRSARRLDGRPHLGISSIDGLLAYGRQALAAGRTREAEAHFRGALAYAPDAAATHGALGLALAAQRRWRDAAVHLRLARPFSPPGSPCAVALVEAERRLAPPSP